MKREAAEKRGRQAEKTAARFLRLKGWRILAERVRTPRGEVDLIAKRGGLVAFVEVKARTKLEDLEQSIDLKRLQRVDCLSIYPMYGMDFDALCPSPLVVSLSNHASRTRAVLRQAQD